MIPRTSRNSIRLGFTVVELLVVIAIIAILASLLLAALGLMRKMSMKAKTMDMMNQLTHSVSTYLDTYSRLGSLTDTTESNPQYGLAFRCDPWYFIYKTPRNMGAEPFFTPTVRSLVTATGANACMPATTPMTATHMCDAFGNQPVNVLSWHIVNGTPAGGGVAFSFTQSIDRRSAAGTPDDITDDIVFHFDSSTQRWDLLKATALTNSTGTLGVQWNSPADYNESLPSGSSPHPPP